MQIEGFWYYLFTGVFEAATIHYAVAKIFGPLILEEGGAAMPAGLQWCWIFLPYKVPERTEKEDRMDPQYYVCGFPGFRGFAFSGSSG